MTGLGLRYHFFFSQHISRRNKTVCSRSDDNMAFKLSVHNTNLDLTRSWPGHQSMFTMISYILHVTAYPLRPLLRLEDFEPLRLPLSVFIRV